MLLLPPFPSLLFLSSSYLSQPTHLICTGDPQQEIKHTGDPSGSEVYTINANLSKEIQISVTLTRPEETPGFKIGEGPKGGMSFFGTDENKREGHIVR